MKFYNREKELAILLDIKQRTSKNAQMTFVVGRRRAGKTKLLLKATESEPTLYFFVARKTEALLCRDFMEEISAVLQLPVYGEITDFRTLFKLLMDLSKTKSFNLVIDEFQEFYNINASIYGDMQNIWDRTKDESRINLLLSGSVYSLMHKIFENSKEPLFGRATQKILLQPFTVDTLKKILADNNPSYTNEDLLAFYTFTGGVAKYVELFVDNHALTLETMVELMTQSNSSFIMEGKNLLIEEFGKEYTTYFSILACIASGYTSRSAIESYLRREVGGYLTRMENDFSIVRKRIPLFAKSETKNVHYYIEDNFLRFWFRFFFKYIRFVEAGAFDKLKEVILRDYPTYSGITLEKYFREKCIETGLYTSIGGYWDKTGHNEIDLIALDELSDTALVAEVKRKKATIKLEDLMRKASCIQLELSPYKVEYRALSMDDM